jgi:hypothetical protein
MLHLFLFGSLFLSRNIRSFTDIKGEDKAFTWSANIKITAKNITALIRTASNRRMIERRDSGRRNAESTGFLLSYPENECDLSLHKDYWLLFSGFHHNFRGRVGFENVSQNFNLQNWRMGKLTEQNR